MNTIPAKFKIAMVIDDNNIDLYITARVILKNNLAEEVLEFPSGIAALQYIAENQNNPSKLPEIIFVDIYMPQMTGFEFMETLNDFPDGFIGCCQCYIISSSLDQNDIDRAEADSNIVAFHQKPLSKALLQTII